jgi:hypothetical protein
VADIDGPPTEREVTRAMDLLETAAWEVTNLQVKSTGVPLKGRNAALIRWLQLLYRFTLGWCLDEDEVDARLWEAVHAAPLNDGRPFGLKEFTAVSHNAHTYAEGDPQRPEVEAAEDVFTPVPLPSALVPDPDRYVDRQSGLLAATLATRSPDTSPTPWIRATASSSPFTGKGAGSAAAARCRPRRRRCCCTTGSGSRT